ncbi:MAG: hypothetical protein A2138_09075 [Deltaproteobacteria bacterium RBG_16_71_12]|nr:MAG: hypothetical protein A2138_09075 [Deltaproteobacteria bacterium RBG_16_71_12]
MAARPPTLIDMSHARSPTITAGLVFVMLVAVAAPSRAQLTGTTTQLTTNPATQLDPAISGDLVVFTDLRNSNEDVYYVDVTTLAEVRVTTSTTNQRLNDVNGTTIVYTDLTPPAAHIAAFDVTSGTTTALTPAAADQNPRIDGATVVFEHGTAANLDVYAVDTATLAITALAATAAQELAPVVSGTRVAFERRATSTAPGEIVVLDLTTMTETVLGDATLDDKRPDIDGDLVVWDQRTPAGDLDVMIYDLSTGLGKALALAGNQRAAHVSGRVVAFDDDSSGTSDVLVHHVDWLVTSPIAAGPATEFLNDIDGGRVVYTGNAAGNFDIWMFEFALEPPSCAVSDDLCVDTTGYTSAHASSYQRSEDGGKPTTDVTSFAAAPGPAVLAIHNHGCSSAVGTLNGEDVIFPSDFNQQVTCFTRDVTLAADNTLEVQVRSVPGCSIDVAILTEDECVGDAAAAAESCEASAFGGTPAALCGLVLLALARVRRRR